MRVVVVALAGFLIGGWSVPLGFVLGISPLVTLLAAAGGGLAGCWAFILAGDPREGLVATTAWRGPGIVGAG